MPPCCLTAQNGHYIPDTQIDRIQSHLLSCLSVVFFAAKARFWNMAFDDRSCNGPDRIMTCSGATVRHAPMRKYTQSALPMQSSLCGVSD